MLRQDEPFPGYSAEEVLDAWDAVRARGRVIDATPTGFFAARRAIWRAQPAHARAMAIVILIFLPYVVLYGGFGLLMVYGIVKSIIAHLVN